MVREQEVKEISQIYSFIFEPKVNKKKVHLFVPGLMRESPGRRFLTATIGPVWCFLGSNSKKIIIIILKELRQFKSVTFEMFDSKALSKTIFEDPPI